MINTTRLVFHNIYDVSNLQNNTFLLYFGLPNSSIELIIDDEILISSSDSEEIELKSEKSNEVVYQTFFSQLSHKFSVFNSVPFEELQSELFLDTCEDYFSIVGKFNSPIFAPIKADVNGNINKLRKKVNQNVLKFQTLYAMINDEIDTRTTNVRNSATDALLWLKRAFEFLSSLLREFGRGDQTLADATCKAYEQSLSRYHGLLARSVFSFALRAVPDKTDFLRSLAIDPNDASKTLFEHQLFNEMLDHASNISSVLEKITLFYLNHGLDSVKIV